jgi:hypothetical protein
MRVVVSDTHVPQGNHDFIENRRGSGMRYFEFRYGIADIPNKGLMVGAIVGLLQSRLDAGNQCIEALSNLGLFGFQSLELRAQFIEGLA